MAYTAVSLPLTGAGDATAAPAVDLIGGAAYQAVKLIDGAEGSTEPIPAKGTTPGSTDHGLVVRPIGSTAHLQGVAGAVGLTSGSSQVGITSGSSAVELTSAGSTRLAGRFTLDNPTTSIDLGSGGSTKLVGTFNATGTTTVNVANPTTSVSLSSQHTVTADLSSAGSTRVIGTVNQGSPAGTSADAWWVRSVTTGAAAGGSTTVDANNTSAGSTKLIGLVDGQPFSSAQLARSTLNSSAEGQLIAANANRKYAAVTNLATGVSLYIGLSTAAVSTAGANAHILIGPLQTFTFGGQVGNLPNYTGPIRARINSTTIAGPAIGLEFT